MEHLRISHYLYSYLPVTQNWIYSQIKSNTICTHAAVSLIEDTPEQFPLAIRLTAFPSASLQCMLARYWIRQPERFLDSSINSLQPDIVHGHFSTEAWRILPYAKKHGIPLVTTFYGLDVDKLSRRHYWKKRYPVLFDYGSAFLVEGPFMGERLKAIGCFPEKLHIVPIGIDTTWFRNLPPRKKTAAPLTVLFTGLNREKKGAVDAARIFIEVAKHIPDMIMSIVGDGCFRKNVEAMFRGSGMLDRVTFHGFCTYNRYRELLIASDIVLVPSFLARDGDSEGGAPVVTIEAHMAGIPIVGTRHCDIPYIVDHGKSGFLFSEHDCNAMAKGLRLLAEDHELRLRFGNHAKRKALQQHDIVHQVAVLNRIYLNCISGNTSGSSHD